MFFRIYLYNSVTDKYEYYSNINQNDELEYSFIDRDLLDISEFEMKLKPQKKYVDLCPRNTTELNGNKMKPMIITKETKDKVLFFTFIIQRENMVTANKKYVLFKGVDFKYFEEYKIILSNKDYPNITGGVDNDDIPSDFAKYQTTTNARQHILNWYNTTLLNPRQITYGAIGALLNDRKFKGLNIVSIANLGTTTYNVQLEQISLLEAKEHIYDRIGKTLVTRQEFIDGKINIYVEDTKRLSQSIVRKNSDLVEQLYGTQQKTNFIAGYGDANNFANVYKLRSIDFTTLEKTEDYSFVSGDNNTYLTNTCKTELSKQDKDRVIRLTKIKFNGMFEILNKGNTFMLEDTIYRVVQIQEKRSAGNPTEYDLDLREEQ